MAEVLVVGKKISEMDLVTDIVGDEKIPTGVVGDKAVTTGQLLHYLDENGKVQWGKIEGDISLQTDLMNKFNQQDLEFSNHTNDHNNPHQVTKAQVGLGNADNTSDANKPISNATQAALDNMVKSVNGRNGDVVLAPADIGYPTLPLLDTRHKSAQYIIDSNGKNQQEVNNHFRSIIVTPSDFGAVGDGVTDDSLALTNAAAFAIANHAKLDGQGKTYACHSVLFDSNFVFENANLVCNKYDTDLVSVLECSSYNDDPRWLTNVYLKNIHIDGKRQLHTGIKDTTPQEDGGRSGFRFIRPVDGVIMENCSANNCASDGIIIFPHGDRSSVNDTVKNFHIRNSQFNGNRRHGGSSNSTNGMHLENVVCNGNGLDISAGAPINSGLRGDTVGGLLYGSGWDVEEYALDVQSTNLHFIDCIMRGNAKSGLLVLTVGSPAGTNKAVITITGGSYDFGVSPTRDDWSVLVTPVTNKNFPSTYLLKVDKVNLNNGDLGGLGVDHFVVSDLIRVNAARALELTTMYATGDFVATTEAASSVLHKTFAPDVRTFSYAPNLMQINTIADQVELRGGINDNSNGNFKLSAYRGIERGSLNFRFNSFWGGADLFYSNLGEDKVAFYRDNLAPIGAVSYSIGRIDARFDHSYVKNAHMFPPSSNDPTHNGEMIFELTSNTQLKIKVKGDDGIIRSGTLTLA